MNLAFGEVIGASREVRAGLFATTGQRLGTSASNIEKDFWVCWILDALYHRLPPGQPRMLFKGGTSLSKAYGLIERFSEDIDITVFREDLGQSATVAELEALSGKKRQEKLDAIRDAYRAYITGPLRECLAGLVADATSGAGRVEIDQGDTDSQTLLVWYPEVEPRDGEYVQPAVKIESGAKSALDPHRLASIPPYISEISAPTASSMRECSSIARLSISPALGRRPLRPCLKTRRCSKVLHAITRQCVR